jgi:uncharacterized membrane-anchored protein YhcB (DUF1043 family)
MDVLAYARLLAANGGAPTVILAAVAALIAGVLVGIAIQKRLTKRRIGSARTQADELVKQAIREAEEERKRR